MTPKDAEIVTTPVEEIPVTVLSVSFLGMPSDDDMLNDVVEAVQKWADGQDIRTPVFTSETYMLPKRSPS